MELLPDLKNISLERWDADVFRKNDLQVDVLRLDKIHPEISGNKWFKLKYYLQRARQEGKTKLVSFGGAYSNHLLALAEACRVFGFSAVGFIRGEKPAQLSPSLLAAKERGMELLFLSRHDYEDKKRRMVLLDVENSAADELLIPEGGAGEEGIRGAAEILSWVDDVTRYSHICSAVGTGTTLAGLMESVRPEQNIMGVSVLKGTKQLEPLQDLSINPERSYKNVQIIHQDHFGGYAKSNKQLIDFMNQIFSESGIPTDFVYTGKLFYSVDRIASEKRFPAGSCILVIHTGGLQGNRSLRPGLLQF